MLAVLALVCQCVGAAVVATVIVWLVVVAISKLRPQRLLDCLPSRAVLITGCDSGFGHELARRLDALGVPVFAGCLLPEGLGARRLAADCSSRLRVLPLDVTSDQQVADAVASVEAALSDASDAELWAVVNNAGISDCGEVDIIPVEKFQQVLNVNTVGAIRVSKAFLSLLKKSKGRLINITSPFGRLPFPMASPYCLSKSALITFSDVLRLEMKKWSVTVCAVEPMMYATALTDVEHLRPKYVENTRQALPDDKESNREAARKNFEVMLRASKWLARKNISEVIDDMVVACIGTDIERWTTTGFLATVMLTLAVKLPDWLKDFLTHRVITVVEIIWR